MSYTVLDTRTRFKLQSRLKTSGFVEPYAIFWAWQKEVDLIECITRYLDLLKSTQINDIYESSTKISCQSCTALMPMFGNSSGFAAMPESLAPHAPHKKLQPQTDVKQCGAWQFYYFCAVV